MKRKLTAHEIHYRDRIACGCKPSQIDRCVICGKALLPIEHVDRKNVEACGPVCFDLTCKPRPRA